MDDNTRLFVVTEEEVRSTHEEDGSACTFHFQDVRPGELHLLPGQEFVSLRRESLRDPEDDEVRLGRGGSS